MTKTIYSQDYKFLVQQLRKARGGAGLTQLEAARLLGKTQSYLSKVESGQIRLDVIQLRDFAKIYKKKLNFFIR